MKIEYRKQIDSETAPWQLLTNIDELLWNGVYNLRVTGDDGSHNLPFRLENDDTVTLVIKDHSHEGMLQGSRTIVQTITRVERSSGNVLSYTRTRCSVNGIPTWNYWTLATDGGAVIDIPKATPSSLGGVIVGEALAVDANGKLSIAGNSIGEDKLTHELNAKINTAAAKANLTDLFVLNDGLLLHTGALVENSTPYSGTTFSAYTDKIQANGELLVANSGYVIAGCKVFNGDEETEFYTNLAFNSYHLVGDAATYYQLEFTKKDASSFTADDLSQVVRFYQRKPVMWNAKSHVDYFITPGTYTIHGHRTNLVDGLPFYNTGAFNAQLTVLACANCVTQILTLLNAGGGDGNVYTRTQQHGVWESWGKLQQNIEVGAIGLGQEKTFDHLTDNGIYSGVNVYATGTDANGYPVTSYETFVLVVINGYLTGGGISQLKYSLLPNGKTSVATREKVDDVWSEWSDPMGEFLKFIDRLKSGLGVNDVVAAADKIISLFK